jgi:hypothetical protein
VPVENAVDALPLLRTRPDLCIGLAFAWDSTEAMGLADYARVLATASPTEVS